MSNIIISENPASLKEIQEALQASSAPSGVFRLGGKILYVKKLEYGKIVVETVSKYGDAAKRKQLEKQGFVCAKDQVVICVDEALEAADHPGPSFHSALSRTKDVFREFQHRVGILLLPERSASQTGPTRKELDARMKLERNDKLVGNEELLASAFVDIMQARSFVHGEIFGNAFRQAYGKLIEEVSQGLPGREILPRFQELLLEEIQLEVGRCVTILDNDDPDLEAIVADLTKSFGELGKKRLVTVERGPEKTTIIDESLGMNAEQVGKQLERLPKRLRAAVFMMGGALMSHLRQFAPQPAVGALHDPQVAQGTEQELP